MPLTTLTVEGDAPVAARQIRTLLAAETRTESSVFRRRKVLRRLLVLTAVTAAAWGVGATSLFPALLGVGLVTAGYALWAAVPRPPPASLGPRTRSILAAVDRFVTERDENLDAVRVWIDPGMPSRLPESGTSPWLEIVLSKKDGDRVVVRGLVVVDDTAWRERLEVDGPPGTSLSAAAAGDSLLVPGEGAASLLGPADPDPERLMAGPQVARALAAALNA